MSSKPANSPDRHPDQDPYRADPPVGEAVQDAEVARENGKACYFRLVSMDRYRLIYDSQSHNLKFLHIDRFPLYLLL